MEALDPPNLYHETLDHCQNFWGALSFSEVIVTKHQYTVDDGVEKYIFSIGFFGFNLIFG